MPPPGNDAGAAAPAAAQASAAAAPLRSASVPAGLLFAVVFAAAALVAWQWYDTRNQVESLREELARRLAEGDARNKDAQTLSRDAFSAMRALEAKIETVESGLTESQNQQVALEALYQQLSRNSDELTMTACAMGA